MSIDLLRKPTRTEKLAVHLELDKSLADTLADDIRVLHYMPDMVDGDLLKINYSFCINYFGNVERALKAVTNLISNPGVVFSVGTNEIEHGECLIQDVLTRLHDLKRIIAERNDARP